jgi:hypothetical protein
VLKGKIKKNSPKSEIVYLNFPNKPFLSECANVLAKILALEATQIK